MTDDDLAPSARMLRTITVAQMRRGDTPGANTLAVLGLELLRLLGDLDDNYKPHTQKEHP